MAMSVSARISQNHMSTLHEMKSSVHVNVGVARSSSDDKTIVLPVLWMTSCLLIIGQAKATPVGRIFKVTHQGAAPGAKSDVYDFLVCKCHDPLPIRLQLMKLGTSRFETYVVNY